MAMAAVSSTAEQQVNFFCRNQENEKNERENFSLQTR